MFEKICKVLSVQAQTFANNHSAKILPLEIKISKNRESAAVVAVEFEDFIFSLKYIVGGFSGPKSIILCSFYKKNDTMPLEYTFYDIAPVLDIRDFRATQYSFVADTDDAQSALQVILSVVDDHFEKLCLLFSSPEMMRELRLSKNAQINEQMSDNVFETANELEFGAVRDDYLKKALGIYNLMELTRYSTSRYSDFLDGNYVKAKRKYLKEKHRTPYEDMLLEYMKSDPQPCPYLNFIKAAEDASSGKRVILPLMLISLLVLTPALTVVYLLLYGAFATFFEAGAVYNSAFELYNAAYAALPAFVTSIALSYFLRRPFIKLFRRRVSKKELAYDSVTNTQGVVAFMRYFLYTVIGMSVISCMLFANYNISFYDDKIVDNGDIFELTGREYRYSDIKSVYESEGIVNDFGVWMEGEHLVITFENGDILDTYFYSDLVNIKRLVYPILEEKGIQIEKEVR